MAPDGNGLAVAGLAGVEGWGAGFTELEFEVEVDDDEGVAPVEAAGLGEVTLSELLFDGFDTGTDLEGVDDDEVLALAEFDLVLTLILIGSMTAYYHNNGYGALPLQD